MINSRLGFGEISDDFGNLFHILPGANRHAEVAFVGHIAPAGKVAHDEPFFQLNELIQFPTAMEKIRQAANPSDVIHALWQWLPKLPESECNFAGF